MRKFPVCFLLLLTASCPLYCQSQDQEVVKAVDRLLLNSKFVEALEQIESASDESAPLLLENKKAEVFTRMGKFEEAVKILEIINTRLTLQPDALLKALTETNLGFLQLSQGRSDLAEETLQNALRGFEGAGKAHSAEAAQALSHLGLAYMSVGKYSQAQEHLHRALALRQSEGNNADEWIAAAYNDLGLVYSQTDKDKALDYFEHARKMYVDLYGSSHPKIAIANINTGIIYRDLELFDAAVNNFETALDIWKSVYSQPHPTKALALYNLGQTYLQLNDRTAAMDYYRATLKMYEDCYGAQHPELATVLNAIGNLQVAESNFEEALKTYQRSLHANVRGFNDTDVNSNPDLKNFYNGARLLHTLLFKAQAFESRYQRKSLKFADLNEALHILTKCDSLIDILRHHSTNEADKLLLGVMANEVYTDGVRIAYQAGLNALKKAPYFERAFYFAEKSKGAVLLESIADTHAKSFAGIPEDLLETEKEIKSALMHNAQRLSGKPSAEEEKSLRKSTFELKRRYEEFIQNLEQEYPDYYNLKFNSATPSISQIQELLGEHTALISYAIDQKNDRLYIFMIRKNRFKVWQRNLASYFDKYLTGLRNSLYFVEINTFRKCSYNLAQTLLPPLPRTITDLIILPAGRLSLIPFEALILDDGAKIDDYGSMLYLMKRYSVRYEFSAGLMLQKSQKKTNATKPSAILLCAPVNFPERKHLGALPGSEKEIIAISDLFRERDLTATTYTRTNADEGTVKAGQLKDYRYLHFATHGVVDESDPELSRILLQSSDNEDGDLFAGEIYNLELNADLVTLSACQTGMGKLLKGEGVIGLSRALVYAGAQNMIVSFWNVADESTALLMKDFYQNLLDNPAANYSEHLRQAKLKLLASEKYTAPFYWAPFVLIGGFTSP